MIGNSTNCAGVKVSVNIEETRLKELRSLTTRIKWLQNDWILVGLEFKVIPKWLDCKMIGLQNDWIAKWLDSKMIGFQKDWIPKWLDSQIIGFQDD